MNKVLVDYKYTNEDVVNTLKLLSPRTTNMNPVRIGNAIDGWYVLLEELIKQNGITYSFGVGHTNLFEQEMTSKYNLTNYMYDHTLIPKFVKRIPKTKNFVKLLNVLLKLLSLNENWLDSIPDCKYSVTNSSSD